MIRSGLLLALLALGATAQDAVRIAGPSSPAPGAVFTLERSRRWSESVRVELDAEPLHEQSAGGSFSYVCKVEVVSGTETRYTFEKAAYEDGGRTRELELDGKTVVATRDGKKIAFTLAGGGMPSDDALEFLEGEFRARREPSLLPAEPVAPGDTWTLPLAALARRLGLEWDEFLDDGFEATARLEEIVDRAGARTARIAISLDVVPEMMDEMRLTEAEMTIEAALEVPVDGSVPHRALTARAVLAGTAIPQKGTDDVMTEYRMTFELKESIRP